MSKSVVNPDWVKTYNVGVDNDDRRVVYIAFNGSVYSMHAFDAKLLFESALKVIETMCGAHATKESQNGND